MLKSFLSLNNYMNRSNRRDEDLIGLLEQSGHLSTPSGPEPKEENRAKLENILDEDEAALQITAPYGAEKVSANQAKRASFTRFDERSVEDALKNIDSDVDDLKLVINSPGGRIGSANKIARSINNNFDTVETYVPHFAKSGGTLVSLTGETIVMGEMSDLGPLDPQIANGNGEQYSTTDLTGSYERWLEKWDNKHPSETSAPEQSMMERMDILEYEEALRMTRTMEHYAASILEDHDGIDEKDAQRHAANLVGGYPVHGYTLTAGEAQEALPDGMVIPEEERQEEMATLRTWMDEYAFNNSSNHVVVYHEPGE